MLALSALAATVQNGWAAFSLLATLAGLGGAGLIAAALLLGAYLPGFLRAPLIVAGAVLLAFAGGLQSGQQRGAAAQIALGHARALEAERTRAEASEGIARDMAAAAVTEREAALSDQAQLERLIHDVAKETASGRLCGTRDDARRLRALRDAPR